MPILRYFIPGFILIFVAIVITAGFRGGKSPRTPLEIFPDMDRQSKVKYQKPSPFFGNDQAAREPVAGTQPIGFRKPAEMAAHPEGNVLANYEYSRPDGYAYTGKMGEFWGDGFPEEFPVTAELLAHGQERYNIYCIVCHGANGGANGISTKFGLNGVPSYHDQRLLKETPNGSIFNTITYGKGLMYGYSANLSVRDRWAVIAYVRTLQKAQQGTVDEVAPESRADLGLNTNANASETQVVQH